MRSTSVEDEQTIDVTYFSPLTTVFAFASKVRCQRFSSDSCARTALLTVCITREAAPLGFPESACTTGKGLVADDMGRKLKTVYEIWVSDTPTKQEGSTC